MVKEIMEVIATVQGEIRAEIIRGLLSAQGIPVTLIQEGAGKAYGLQVGPLGEVQVLVPSSYSSMATRVLEDCEAGLFEGDINQLESEQSDSDEIKDL